MIKDEILNSIIKNNELKIKCDLIKKFLENEKIANKKISDKLFTFFNTNYIKISDIDFSKEDENFHCKNFISKIKKIHFENCTFKNINISGGFENNKELYFIDAKFNYDDDNTDIFFENCTIFSFINFNSEQKSYKIKNLNFENSIFKDKVCLNFIDFKNLNFINTKFENCIDLIGTTLKNASFNKTWFNSVSFNKSKFYNIKFENINFTKSSDFIDCKFIENIQFNDLIFEKVNFTETTFYKETKFIDTIFKDEATFNDTTFHKTTFEGKLKIFSKIKTNENYLEDEYYKLFSQRELFCKNVNFNFANFNDEVVFKYFDFNFVTFTNTDFKKYVKFDGINFLSQTNFNIKNSEETQAIFNDVTFYKLVDFANCNLSKLFFEKVNFLEKFTFNLKINEELNFKNTTFAKDANFNNFEFQKKVNFENCYFLSKTFFTKTVFKDELNLEGSIFHNISNFFGITLEKQGNKPIKVANRETARIIKDSFEKANNIIEANRYYALEMSEREKELNGKFKEFIGKLKELFKKTKTQSLNDSPENQNIKKESLNKTANFIKNDFLDYLVFKIHKISSNHSQNWILPIYWIVTITLFYSTYKNLLLNNAKTKILDISNENFILQLYQTQDSSIYCKYFVLGTSFIVVLSLIVNFYYKNREKEKSKNKILNNFSHIWTFLGVAYLTMFYSISSNNPFEDFSTNLNPFSIMNDNDKIGFWTLIYKIIIAYLIYQFVISIRQNTRRK